VALVGVKELHKMIETREATITRQEAEIAALKKHLARMETALNRVLATQHPAPLVHIVQH
jgi:hypothetical protein